MPSIKNTVWKQASARLQSDEPLTPEEKQDFEELCLLMQKKSGKEVYFQGAPWEHQLQLTSWLFNHSLDGKMVYALEPGQGGRLLEVNQSICALLGYSREEMLAPGGVGVLPFDLVQLARRTRKNSHEMEYPFRRLRLKRKDGSIFPADLRLDINELTGQEYLLVVVRDMTDQEQSYESLRESEKRMNALLNSIPDMILHMDKTGKILKRKGWGEGVDASSTGSIALLSEETFHKVKSFFEFVPREMLPLAKETIAEVLATQKSNIMEYQRRNVGKTGEIRDFEARMCPVDENEVLLLVREITDRKRKDAALAQSEKRLRLLYNSNPNMIFNLGPDQKIRSVNTSALETLGYTEEELLGHSRILLVHKEDREMAAGCFQKYNLKDGPLSCEYRMMLKDGSWIWVEERARVTKDLKSRKAIVISCRDISRRREAEQAILDNLKEKEVLLREIHHRVKNNLQIINSMLSLQMGQFDNPELHETLKNSQNRILSMSLIHENLYRSEGLDNINTKEYFRELCSHLFSAYDIAPGKISVEYAIEDISLGLEHAIPLGLIVNELVINVIKYAFEGMDKGEVHISLDGDEEEVRFEFRDNGRGMPEHFDFKNAKSMGLRLIRILSRQLRGKAIFENKDGLSLRLTFPRKEAH